jgi:DNA-binding CsgD family transcriptional regulator
LKTKRKELLTPRQRDVLESLALGFTDNEIGRWLGISDNTVNTHMKIIFFKFGVRTRAGAVSEGYKRGILGAHRK